MPTLGVRLRKAREKKGWSQTYVCRHLGISNSAMSGYERDYREPDAETLSQLARLYEVSIDYLVNGDIRPIDNPDKMSENSTHKGEDSDIEIDPEWQELYEQVKEKGAKLEATVLLRAVADGRMTKDKLEALLLALDFIDKKG